MSENVSSTVLFHFTKSMDALKGILKHGFVPHYCPEYTLARIDREAALKRLSPTFAVPMVSFCDLPLSLIRKHLDEYGSFGIGLAKKWGRRNGVAPVIYTHRKARTRQPVLRLVAEATQRRESMTANDLNVLAAYTKPFAGPAWRSHRLETSVQFYDEREWRYVPPIRGPTPLFLHRKDYQCAAKRDALHEQLKRHHALPIPPDAIQYLIVPYDRQEMNILDLHDYIMRFYGKRYGRKEAILVTTAIMTDDCIEQDV